MKIPGAGITGSAVKVPYLITQFGTGAIKGFAVTLSVGVTLSLFTALFITKVIFNMRKQYKTLSI